jgi:catechol 2,3-dioxygenase-like lactoylglutathione lyase family enzyme
MLEIFRKTNPTFPINPRFRAYGKARIDIAKRAETRDDWDQLWKKPTHPFPFLWGSSWKQCIEYKVADFPAEVGFFIDILGFPVNAFDPDYAMFTDPNGDFFFSVVPAREGETPTPLGAIRLQFMVQDIIETAIELKRRGVKFTQMPARVADNSAFLIGSFHTPNGIGIELWGFDAGGEKIYSDPWSEPSKEEQEIKFRKPEKNSDPEQPDNDQFLVPPEEQMTEQNRIPQNGPDSQGPVDELEYLNRDEYSPD